MRKSSVMRSRKTVVGIVIGDGMVSQRRIDLVWQGAALIPLRVAATLGIAIDQQRLRLNFLNERMRQVGREHGLAHAALAADACD